MEGGQTKELSLSETIARASQIREIVDSSPLVTAALHRLVLAVLHRCLDGPRSDDDWRQLWARQHFDRSVVNRYLQKWRRRFDLFDAHLPFYQTAGLDVSKAGPVSKLTHELSAGNNPILFDHSIDADPQPLTPAEAARYLVALHAFAVGGLVSFQKGEERHRSADAAPLAKGAVILLTGVNLFQTLMLNMVNVDGRSSMPFEFDPARDRPAWERQASVTPAERHPDGYLDLLTWQSRRVLLVPERDGGSVVVRKVIVMKGYQFPDGADLHGKETMVAFQKREKAQRGDDPWPPVGFGRERALWRDSLALLQKSTGKRQRPRTVDELAYRDLGRQQPVTLCAFGISSDRAKVFLWRHERLPLPTAYVRDDELLAKLGEALKLAEVGAERLRSAVRVMAERALSPAGNPDKKRLRELVDSLAAERLYWARLDVPFRRLMADLPDAWSRDEEHITLCKWATAVRGAARNAFEAAARSLETSARGLRAAAGARGQFEAGLNKLVGPYIKTQQGEEETV